MAQGNVQRKPQAKDAISVLKIDLWIDSNSPLHPDLILKPWYCLPQKVEVDDPLLLRRRDVRQIGFPNGLRGPIENI
jgi:hypothetical protein